MADCDVAVVGAGIIGEAITYELVSRGVSVTLLDARGAGLGATQASAGMLVPYLEGVDRPFLPMAVRSLEMYDAFVDRLSRDTGLGIGYQRTGSLQVVSSRDSFEALVETAEHVKTAGLECQLLEAAEAAKAEPNLSPEIAGGLLIPTHGFVVAADLSGALAAGAMKHGARVRVPARVKGISQRGGEVEIELENDKVVAGKVVVAAGSWTSQIRFDGIPQMPVHPVRGQLLHLGWDSTPLIRILWGERCYLVPAMSGSVLVGATVEDAGYDERTTVAGVRDLLEAACDLVPHLWKAAFLGVRVGLRPATPDEMPIIGRRRELPGIVFATGHFRNGVLLAPVTAKLVADLIIDNREDPLLAAVSPQRFEEH